MFHSQMKLILVSGQPCPVAIVNGACYERHALEAKEWIAGRQQLHGPEEESRAADHTTDGRLRLQVVLYLTQHLADGESRQAEQNNVGIGNGLLRVVVDAVEPSLQQSAVGCLYAELLLPSLRVSRQHADIMLPLRSNESCDDMSQIATSTNAYFHSDNPFSPSISRRLSSWLRTAMRIYWRLGSRPGFRLQSRVRMLCCLSMRMTMPLAV